MPVVKTQIAEAELNVRPKRPADAAGIQNLLDVPHRRLPAIVLMDEQRHPGLPARADHSLARGIVQRHRLLANDRLPVFRRQQHELLMRFRPGRHIHKIEFLRAEHLLGVRIHLRDPEFSGKRRRFRLVAIADRRQPRPRHLSPCSRLELCPESSPNETERQRPHDHPQMNATDPSARKSNPRCHGFGG